MNDAIIYPTETSVINAMKLNNLKKVVLYLTAYVNHSNQQTFGYSVLNINSDYYLKQKCISSKTKTFYIN